MSQQFPDIDSLIDHTVCFCIGPAPYILAVSSWSAFEAQKFFCSVLVESCSPRSATVNILSLRGGQRDREMSSNLWFTPKCLQLMGSGQAKAWFSEPQLTSCVVAGTQYLSHQLLPHGGPRQEAGMEEEPEFEPGT